MHLGLGLGVNLVSNIFTFDPISLFSSGELGFIFDLSDNSTVFQERSSPSTPSANNDPIGTLVDLSGNSLSPIAPADGQRPTYKVSGGQSWAEFVSASASSLKAFNVNFNDPITFVIGIRITEAIATDQEILCGYSSFARMETVRAANGRLIFDGNITTIDLGVDEDLVLTGKFGDSGSSSIAKNSGSYEVSTAGPSGAGGITLGTFSDGATNPTSMRLYRAIGIKRILTDAEIIAARQWCAAAAGLSL